MTFADSEITDLTLDQIRNEILKFKNDAVSQRLSDHYTSKSIAEIYGTSRKELMHSRFIAWLLNDEETHGLGHFPLHKFLETLVIASLPNHQINKRELFDAIITGEIRFSNTKTAIERSIPGVGRLDIFIETNIKYSGKERKLQLVIENKVLSKEHSDQTTSYYSYFQENFTDDTDVLFVYLTALSGVKLNELQEQQMVECGCKEFIQINYQYLVDYLIEPMLSKELPQKVNLIIRDYLQTLSQPALSDETEDFKQELIMAIGKEERELLSKFWEQNQKLILSAIYAISTDPEQDVDTRNTADKLINEMGTQAKDRSRINIYLNDELKVKNIRKADIGYQTVLLIESSGLMSENVFTFLRNNNSCGFQLLKKHEEVTENEKQYRRYRVNNEPELIYKDERFYVARNWGINNISSFIDACQSRLPQLNFEID
jgi:hypothetical protein